MVLVAHPGREVDDVRRLVLLEDELGRFHVPNVSVLAAKEDVLFLLLRLLVVKRERTKKKKKVPIN